MERLVFVSNWGNKKKAAWSGTVPGLYHELQKHYAVERFDMDIRVPELFLFRCLEKLGLGRFDMEYMKHYTKVFEKRYPREAGQKVFQFDECPAVDWTDSYIFQDLSVGFLLDVYEHRPELIPYCGLENLSKRYLEKRAVSQKTFYQKVNGVFTMGRWLADYLVEKEELPREKVHAVGGGVNVDITGIDASEKKGNKILFVGRDFKRKGGDLTVQAFRLLKKRLPEAELYLAGPAVNPVDDTAGTEGIFYLGEQNGEQVKKLYNKCDVFCMPSRFEAYGLVFAEALVFGLPCIARNAFAMSEFIQDGENGYLLEEDDVEMLADKMEAALKNKEMKQYVVSQREIYLKEYSWEAVVNRIAEVMGE